MKKTLLLGIIASLMLLSCSEKKTNDMTSNNVSNPIESAKVSGVECDVTINNIHFTKSINDAASSITVQEDGKVVFEAKAKSDYFSDPNGKLSNTSAPILLTEIDNTKPFTFSAKVTPGFTIGDLYNAGVLYVYAK